MYGLYYILILILVSIYCVECFNILDYSHYMDYLPYKQEGLSGLISFIISSIQLNSILYLAFEDFRTAPIPPSQLRNRKMEVGSLKDFISVEGITKFKLN